MAEVRVVQGEDLVTAVRVFELSLGEEFGDDGRAAMLGYFEGSRVLGGFEDGRQVATAASFPAELTMPGGGTAPVHAVTGVGTLPTHMRRGISRALMVQQLREARADGAVANVLMASEAPLYGRYGYGAASTRGIAALETSRSAFRDPVEVDGHFDYADGSEAVAHFAQPIFEAWRVGQPGQLSRPPHNWAMLLVDVASWRGGGGELRWVFHVDGSGTPDGYVAYRVVNRWDNGLAASEAKVTEIVAADQAVRAALFRFVCDLPLVEYVNITDLAEDDPLVHRLVDVRRVRTVQRDDGLWVRILDVPRALEARGWGVDGEAVIDVRDDLLADVAGRWRLAVRDGVATVTPTDDAPDLSLGVEELGTVWLGGFTVRRLVDAGRATAASAEVLTRVSRMFRGDVAPNHVGEF